MVVGKLTQDGQLKVKGINTRLPLVTDGLISHYPMDGKSGTFDIVGGTQSLQNTSYGSNLLEAMDLNWRDPSSWSDSNGMVYDEVMGAMKISGYRNSWLITPIIVNTNMSYEISIEVMETVQSGVGLYLGGYSLDADGTRATTNFDYTLATNDQPATGVWKTYRLTRTGTATAASYTSTSFATVKGWTGDAGRLIKYYHFGGLFNYNSGGELYIRNLSIVVTNSDTSNATITNDGIAIEEATTNLYRSPDNMSAIWTRLNTAYDNLNYKFYASSSGITTRYILQDVSVVSGLLYTQSVICKKGENNILQITGSTGFNSSNYINYNLADGTMYNIGIATGTITLLSDGWYKCTFTDIGSVTTGGRFILGLVESYNSARLVSYSSISGYGIFMKEPQIEQKAFSTEFINGSKAAAYLTLPVEINTGDFTIYGKFIPDSNSDLLLNGSSFLNLGNGFTLATYNGSPFINGNVIAGASNNNIHINYNTLPNDEVIYVIKRSGTIFSWRMIDSRQDVTWTKVHANVATIDILYMDFSCNWGGRMKDLSVYNRALADEEIKLLIKGTHRFTLNSLIAKSINSRPAIPSDAIYYPLDINARDESLLYSPTEENGNFTDGLYIGSGNSIEYNFYNSLGLDWNGDWSICYFKKPMGTHVGETSLTGYNIESIGCNSNSVGGGYLWFGKVSSANSIQSSDNGAFLPEIYFGNWQCVTMVKSGTIVTINTWLNDSVLRRRTLDLGAISANRFVTQYGYDFKLNGWDNGYQCFSYFRDLIVLKRAMTTEELNLFTKAKMSASKDQLRIAKNISTLEL